MDYIQRLFLSSYVSCWTPGEELREKFPPRHSDYRDTIPAPLVDIHEEYAPYVQDGRWTVGLCDMWCPKAKYVKHSVHIPCWDSYKVLPWKWRGCIFGRNLKECYWFGLRETRWARTAYAANLGREYVMPVAGVGTHGYKSEIEALCWLTYILACVFSCGIGQVFSICGNAGANCAACYTCHTRSRIRHRYGLPPVFGLPLGIDDCCVHLLCFYCASHQEMRELVIRGVDGPGMHAMDVCPHSYDTAPEHEEVYEKRKKWVEKMLSRPPKQYTREAGTKHPDVYAAVCANVVKGIKATCHRSGAAMVGATDDLLRASTSEMNFGWAVRAPTQQNMSRECPGTMEEVEISRIQSEEIRYQSEACLDPYEGKAWSVAY